MTIDPKDLKTLAIRVTLLTLAVRMVPMIGTDLTPSESAIAYGLGVDGATTEPFLRLLHHWAQAVGNFSFLVRLPQFIADLTMPFLAIAYARAAGWGAIPGLFAGLILAMAPLGIAAGYRLDGGALISATVLGSLVLLRQGLREGQPRRILLSNLLLLLGAAISPLALLAVPAGIYMGYRAVAMDNIRRLAMFGWPVVALLILAARYAFLGHLAPEPNAAALWRTLHFASGDASNWGQDGLPSALLQILAAFSPAGPIGALADQVELTAAPIWAWAAATGATILAVWGLARGQVRPDPEAEKPDAERGTWRTIGITAVQLPRNLGDRDWLPLLLIVAAALLFCLRCAHLQIADGLNDALAAVRPAVALLLGVGVTAALLPKPKQSESDNLRARHRFNGAMALLTMLVFLIGALHLLAHTGSPDRLAPRKVARAVLNAGGQQGAVLALGGRGLAVSFILDPTGVLPNLRRSSLKMDDALEQLLVLMRKKPKILILAGDRDALGTTDETPLKVPQLGRIAQTLDDSLTASGWQTQDDGHLFLGKSALMVYSQELPTLSPGTIVPQLGPGQVP